MQYTSLGELADELERIMAMPRDTYQQRKARVDALNDLEYKMEYCRPRVNFFQVAMFSKKRRESKKLAD